MSDALGLWRSQEFPWGGGKHVSGLGPPQKQGGPRALTLKILKIRVVSKNCLGYFCESELNNISLKLKVIMNIILFCFTLI